MDRVLPYLNKYLGMSTCRPPRNGPPGPSSDCARQGLEDFIASHAHIALNHIRIDTDPATTTQGPITDHEGRLAPAQLAPWKDGFDILGDVFNCLLTQVESSAEPHTFSSRLYVNEMGEALSVINSEAAVHLFDVDNIYKPAKKILDAALCQPASLRASLTPILRRRGYKTAGTDGRNTNGEIVFSPHSRTITAPAHIASHKRKRSDSGTEEEIRVANDASSPAMGQSSPATGQGSPIQPVVRINSVGLLSTSRRLLRRLTRWQENNNLRFKSGPGDYYCSFVSNDASNKQRRLLAIGEAKAPHKLTRELIHSALGANASIDTTQFIRSTDRDDHEYDEGQKWLAAVVMQIYSALLKNKQRYGYITTGESYVLVRIPPGSPAKIEYLSLPALRAAPGRDEDTAWLNWLAATPLARLSCLVLLSMFSDGDLTQAECAQATAAGSTLVWRDARVREQSLTTSFTSMGSAVTKSSGDQEWTEPRSQTRTRARPHDHDGGGGGAVKRPRLSTSSVHRLTPPLEAEHTPCASSQQNIEAVPFCTPSCILSLTNVAAPTVLSCPNFEIHKLHPHPHPDLPSSIRSSIDLPRYNYDNDTDNPPILWDEASKNATYTAYYGATSALFKVRIEPGGYVLVAKAARSREAVRGLHYEKQVYQRLRALQGDAIPVCAGLVDLTKELPKPKSFLGHRFPAFLLLSWGGTPLLRCGHLLDRQSEVDRWKTSVDAVLKKVHDLGILHNDAEPRNLVFHGNVNDFCGLLLVDFERAISRGQLRRRAIRAHATPEKAELDFRRACERERASCLRKLDDWATRRARQAQ